MESLTCLYAMSNWLSFSQNSLFSSFQQLHRLRSGSFFCPIFGQPEAHCLHNSESSNPWVFLENSLSFLSTYSCEFFWKIHLFGGKFHKNRFNTWVILQNYWKSNELLNKSVFFCPKFLIFFFLIPKVASIALSFLPKIGLSFFWRRPWVFWKRATPPCRSLLGF